VTGRLADELLPKGLRKRQGTAPDWVYWKPVRLARSLLCTLGGGHEAHTPRYCLNPKP
jgi:hypothetical protein